MKIFLYVLTAIGSLIGGYFLLMALTVAESAPQEASLAAIAVAFAVLPYVFARAVERADAANEADDIRVIADYYRRLTAAAEKQRLAETRQASGLVRSGGSQAAANPFAPGR